MGETSIEWTDKTWNPVRGCSRVSEGCRNCYAEAFAARFSDPEGLIDGETGGPPLDGRSKELVAPAGHWHGYATRTPDGPRWTGKVSLLPKKLHEPLTWRKPSRVFVNSMSDLFHEKLPDEAIDQIFAVMALAHRHTFQILTKRPERMHRYLAEHAAGGRHIWPAAQKIEMPRGEPKPAPGWPLQNVWVGVSVEDQKTADARIPLLLQTPAAVRFVSYEPALGPVDFTPWLVEDRAARTVGLDLVIVGGESGPGARTFNVEWARSVVRQCKATGVPAFVKQLGARPVVTEGSDLAKDWALFGATSRIDDIGQVHLRDRKGGDPSEWPLDIRVRQFPEVQRGK